MSFSRENYLKIREQFAAKQASAREEAARRAEQLYRLHPELKEIDRALSGIGQAVFAETMRGKEGLDERLAKLRRENEELQQSRAQCLRYYGYPEDYTDPHYECAICSDTGAVGSRMCVCMKRALILATYESSGMPRFCGLFPLKNKPQSHLTGGDRVRQDPSFHSHCKRGD